jgi:hypothetical protein
LTTYLQCKPNPIAHGHRYRIVFVLRWKSECPAVDRIIRRTNNAARV